ncbi:unnamed protein product [Arabidopsis thaliana]|uniref:MADS-box domain-containing protein n=1 Tax=Arabidopsis thaliana TaxID=3702 RepID=A0A5S9X1D2_ARATH|nr:unnamed protein product [Arabidopsis thaliana]
MGRKKLKLKRIESIKERSSKFSKRKKGLFKKAEEVALLCDSDILLIVVSPTEKPTVFNTRSRSFHTILERFCMLSLQEREERRAYTIKTLKKLVNENNTEISTENDQFSPENNQLSPENDQFLSEMDQFSSKNQYLSESDEVIQDDNKVTKLRELKELYAEKMVILRLRSK